MEPTRQRPDPLAPGYSRTGEQLADLEERTALLLERLALLRRVLPPGAVHAEAARREARRRIGGELAAIEQRLAALDEQIEARTGYAVRFGIDLPLERIRARFQLAAIDVEILSVAATLERGASYED